MTRADIVKAEAAPAAITGNDMSFGEMLKLGDALVSTGFLPQHIRTGAQAVAIMLTGRELGIPLMRSLRSFAMVKGKVTEGADSQLARFKASGGRATFTKLTDTEATLTLRHPNGDEHTESFTLKDANAAGIVNDMYKKYPKAMLRSRAITAGLKSLGWDGAVGVYDPAELADVGPVTHEQARPASVDEDGVIVEDKDWAAEFETVVALSRDAGFDDETLGEAAGFVLKGKALGEMNIERLTKIGEWAMEKGRGDIASRCAVVIVDHERQESLSGSDAVPA